MPSCNWYCWLELVLDWQQDDETGHETLPECAARILVVMHFHAIVLGQPNEIPFFIQQHTVAVLGLYPDFHVLDDLPCQLRALDIQARLGVDGRRTRIEIETCLLYTSDAADERVRV